MTGKQNRNRPKLGISGSYGGMNLGDEAILESIVQQIRSSMDAEITIFSRNPDDTTRRHDVDRAVPVHKLTRDDATEEVRGLDLFVLGGGGILYDSEVETYLREVVLAHEHDVPVMIYAVGAGPLERRENRKMVKEVLSRAAAVTVRDREAHRILESIDLGREIVTVADPAMLLEPEPLNSEGLGGEGITTERPLIGMSVREPGPAAPDMDVDHYHLLLSNAADFMVNRYEANVVFVPMERDSADIQHSHAVIARMKHADHAHVLNREYSARQMISIVSQFQLVVGMRLHFLIFAAHERVPFIALPYASKVEGFLDEMKMPMTTLREVSSGFLIADIDRAWDHRDEMRHHIDQNFPPLQERARETHRILVELLQRDSPGKT